MAIAAHPLNNESLNMTYTPPSATSFIPDDRGSLQSSGMEKKMFPQNPAPPIRTGP